MLADAGPCGIVWDDVRSCGMVLGGVR
jgi:hypothetical protein